MNSPKSYADFIHDLCCDASLLRRLQDAVPFSDPKSLARWFLAQGYTLSEADRVMLFSHQSELLDGHETIKY